MKKIIYLSSLILLFVGCKKEEIKDPVVKETPTVHITNYQVTVITGASNYTGDTLIMKKNNINVVAPRYGSNVSNPYTFTAKTGDKISVYYSPGTVLYNNQNIIDENGINIFLDHDNFNGAILEEGCRCKTNFEYILQ